jgi:hypothetical protein
MDEGPQVTDHGDAADSGARGDVSFSATKTPADSSQEAPAGLAQDADQPDDESAGTESDLPAQASDQPPAAEATEGDRPPAEASPQAPPPELDSEIPAPGPQAVVAPPEPEAALPPELAVPGPEAAGPEAPEPAAAEPEAAEPEAAEPEAAEPEAAEPEAAEPGRPEPEAPVPEAPVPEAPVPEPAETSASQDQTAGLYAELTDLGARLAEVAASAAELSRLRSRDTDLIAKLHDDVTRLRSGEIAVALNPVVIGMIKLHDQMVSLGAIDDPASPVGMLHTQLLQIMELTCAVRPFMPAVGEPFDASHHTGTRRRPTTDTSLDGTIAAAIKAGFVRADGTVVRVAEVEVHRLSS